MDFTAYVSACKWASLRLDRLETLDGDLAIDGVRIDKVENATYRRALSVIRRSTGSLDSSLSIQK